VSLSPSPPIAVLDSSVIVPRWSRLVLQRLAARAELPFVPVWSEWIIAETWRTLAWRWLTRAAHPGEFEWNTLTSAANEMLRYLLPVMQLVSLREYVGPESWPELADADDVPIWQTAIVAHAQYVVSHNVADFPPLVQGRHSYRGVEYLTAIEFVEDVLGESATEIYASPLPAGGSIRSLRVL
jgi:hypothetical protein